MNLYFISNSESGHEFGYSEAMSAEEALDLLCIAAGYASLADAQAQTGKARLMAEEVEAAIEGDAFDEGSGLPQVGEIVVGEEGPFRVIFSSGETTSSEDGTSTRVWAVPLDWTDLEEGQELRGSFSPYEENEE